MSSIPGTTESGLHTPSNTDFFNTIGPEADRPVFGSCWADIRRSAADPVPASPVTARNLLVIGLSSPEEPSVYVAALPMMARPVASRATNVMTETMVAGWSDKHARGELSRSTDTVRDTLSNGTPSCHSIGAQY
ncbi:hypothetical protein FHS55_004504 [Angulomicrobium tetraedrale]|uniref:Uncharacterized protein n=1 Tax=Ancylobacter tetraedralis TaxID=217068 RepID=A0A839ZGA6_9HYPH|nr:hypothetical protein [Ancylobacter tetraedralis]MBB3773859.1 hypothetical protein [Ancylobacter tetraedralis]